MIAAFVLPMDAGASPRDTLPRPQAVRAPATPPPSSGPQTEPTNLDEGKTPAQFFASSCAVCHQSPQGLAKGRSAGALGTFLRQHYTTSSAQASTIAGFLASPGLDRGRPASPATPPAASAPTPARATPPERAVPAEPAATARRPTPKPDPRPEEGRKPPEPAVAATQPSQRIRTEDGRSEPVEGLIVLPPGATDIPEAKDSKEKERPPASPARSATPAAPSRDSKPVERETPPADRPTTKPQEVAKPQEAAPPTHTQAPIETATPEPAKPPTILSPLTEERPVPTQVQEIPL